jgi:hypothetical protein
MFDLKYFEGLLNMVCEISPRFTGLRAREYKNSAAINCAINNDVWNRMEKEEREHLLSEIAKRKNTIVINDGYSNSIDKTFIFSDLKAVLGDLVIVRNSNIILMVEEQFVEIADYNVEIMFKNWKKYEEYKNRPLNGLSFHELISNNRPRVLGRGTKVHTVPQGTAIRSLCDCGWAYTTASDSAVVLNASVDKFGCLTKNQDIFGFFKGTTEFDGRRADQCFEAEIMRRPISDFQLGRR